MQKPALILLIVAIGAAVVAAAPAAKGSFKARVKLDPYRDFAGDKDLEIADEPDDKPPSDFTGNAMHATITNTETRQYGKGKFKNSFETQNGIQVSQVGKLRDDKVFVVMGSYSYTGADGRRYRVKYTADEFGYHPITELDLDIPELELKPAAVAATTRAPFKGFGAGSSGGGFGGGNGKNVGSGSGGNGGNGGKNGAGGSNNGTGNQFTYGKATPPPSSAVAHTYLPPSGYLPPATYLPPIGVKPTRRP